jgi:hypothetical protein
MRKTTGPGRRLTVRSGIAATVFAVTTLALSTAPVTAQERQVPSIIIRTPERLIIDVCVLFPELDCQEFVVISRIPTGTATTIRVPLPKG